MGRDVCYWQGEVQRGSRIAGQVEGTSHWGGLCCGGYIQVRSCQDHSLCFGGVERSSRLLAADYLQVSCILLQIALVGFTSLISVGFSCYNECSFLKEVPQHTEGPQMCAWSWGEAHLTGSDGHR